MTGLEKILSSIENDAQKEYNHKLNLCRRKCSQLLFDADKKASAEYENILSEARQKALNQKQAALNSAKRDFSANVLQIKTNAIYDVIEKAKNTFINSDELFNKAFEIFFKKCDIKSGDIFINDYDRKRLNKVNQKLIQNFNIRQDCNFEHGFCINSGNIMHNYSVDAVFEKEKDNLWDLLGKILFC